jgi:hypothetical protein
MNEKLSPPLPEPIRQLQEQLNQFRLTHARRSKLPESLWTAATALAREHGIYAVAHPLRLDYVGLKKRLAEAPVTERKTRKETTAKSAFVELSVPRRPGNPGRHYRVRVSARRQNAHSVESDR